MNHITHCHRQCATGAALTNDGADKASEAAEIMGITASRLKTMGLIDKVISEPLGGAHRDYSSIMQSVKKELQVSIKKLQGDTTEVLLEKRFKRLMEYGKFKEIEIK